MSNFTASNKTYDYRGRLLRHTHGSEANQEGYIYIVGDEFTDGSIRLILTPGETIGHIEKRTNGVWNDDSLRTASSSLELGRDLIISATAGFISTDNPSETVGHQRTLLPHIEFDSQLGTVTPAHYPTLDSRKTFIVYDGPATGQKSGTLIGQIVVVAQRTVIQTSIHQVGSIGATDLIDVSLYKGTDNTGLLISRQNLPASAMPTDGTLNIVYDEDIAFDQGENIYHEWTSAAPISLKTNAAGDVLTTHLGNELDEVDAVLDELVITNDLCIVFDNSFNFIVNNRFPL